MVESLDNPTIFYLESVPGPKTKVLGEGLGHCPRPAILGLGRCLGRRVQIPFKFMLTTFLLGLVPKTNVTPSERSDDVNYCPIWVMPVDTCYLIPET